MTTDQVNPEPTDVTTELYKAVIGPKSQDYYLHRFGQFDADSKKRVAWHWFACLATLNWLAFRRMWGWALGYAAVVTTLALGIFGLGRLVFSYSSAATTALAALFLLAAFVLPGLFANAVYYRFCKTKIAKAVAASADIQEAYARLAKGASTNKRANILALINVVALVLIAAIAILLPRLTSPEKKLPLTKKAAPAPKPAASKPKPIDAPPAAVPAAASAPAAPASAPAAPGTPVANPATTSVQAPSASTSKPEPPEKPQKPKAVEMPVTPVQTAKPAKPEVLAETGAGTSRASDQPPPQARAKANRADRRFFIQVGAFAKNGNVVKARGMVEAIGLATFTQPVETPVGRLTRVRVGPFDSRAEADKALAQIRATSLDTWLLRL